MNFTQLNEIFLQQWYFFVKGLMGLSMQILKNQNWTEFSWRNNVYTIKVNEKTRLDYCFAMEYTYFQ